MLKIDAATEQILLNLAKDSGRVNIKSEDVMKEIKSQNLHIPEIVIKRICAALNSGKHIILTGSPGTAKTTVAKIVAKVAQQKDAIFTTASADWSIGDTLGSYMPDIQNPRKLKFETGIILDSIISNSWIIIDELNRTDIDSCLGPLFSLLSDNEVELTYRSEITQNRIRIKIGENKNNVDTFYRKSNWRIISTMNYLDKNSLFEMSDALIRRFSIIPIDIPSDYDLLVEEWCINSHIDQKVRDNLIEIVNKIKDKEIKQIGPAIVKDMIKYMECRRAEDDDVIMHYSEALVQLILPQLQGLESDEVVKLNSIVQTCLKDNSEAQQYYIDNLSLYVDL